MHTVTLAHISDLHLPFDPHLTLRERLSKRQLSVWSFRRRGHNQSATILARLRADVQRAAVDHVVITGDITNFSLPAEFTAAAAWLQTLSAPECVSLVPGNHDQLVPVPDADGLGRWAAWTRLTAAGWPFVHELDGVVLIGLNTAVPTPPLLARGRVGAAQRERLAQCLHQYRDRCRVVLLHHPLPERIVTLRKALSDRRAVRGILARVGAELVLYGHARDAHQDAIPGPHGPIPCLCVPSSSATPNPHDAGARWNRLTLARDAQGWTLRVQTRIWSVAAGAFIDAGDARCALPRQVHA